MFFPKKSKYIHKYNSKMKHFLYVKDYKIF